MSVAVARLLTDRIEEAEPVVKARALHSVDSLTHGLDQLERLVGAERFTLTRVRSLDWEARTLQGDVGRGVSLADAVYDLIAVL